MKRRGTWLILLALAVASGLNAQVLTEWKETRSSSTANEIALGYPVPIPVDTPLPFDGFRTFAGLHLRHQDLAGTTSYVHPENIGATQNGRTIWAYRLGDGDLVTVEGLAEPATLTNGGIHAREWQSPEVVTGILELMALHENDRHFYDYLRDNVNMVVIPTLNIDGFLQTQRYPALNYLQSDPDNPTTWPRDGRMRRKNMRDVDEVLNTTADHLGGIDLNRNNRPFWATSPTRSSNDVRSLVYHGTRAASESETQALDMAAQLGPIGRLRLYTDVHSFSMVHFWGRNNNSRLAGITESVLRTFSNHHREFPAGKQYWFADRNSVPRNAGIGTTDEYFTHTYEVPSWTLEIEPSNGQSYHWPLPGSGADYGGTNENGHDGFILPEAEIRRVREQLAQSFAAVYYRQAGPPAVSKVRIVDPATDAVVYMAGWDVVDGTTRTLYSQQFQPLGLGYEYDLWVAFNKPMRWREDGVVVPFPGQPDNSLNVESLFEIGDDRLNIVISDRTWLDQAGSAPDGFMNYRDDSLRLTVRFTDDAGNRALVNGGVQTTFALRTPDMTGSRTDPDPASVADWSDGAWTGYGDASTSSPDFGGYDRTLSFEVSDQPVQVPFLLQNGITSAWRDPDRNGEGFLIEMLANDTAVMYWFTYGMNGEQDWYIGKGQVRGNRIEFTRLIRVSGGEFGPGFDPAKVNREVVGYASFIWSGCDTGTMNYRIGNSHGRMQLRRITDVMGVDCGVPGTGVAIREEALLNGSWYDPTHSGEGFIIEVLTDGSVVIYWFSFDPDGNRRWFFGLGEIRDGKLVFDDIQTTSGGIFGPGFDPADVVRSSWGTLELELDCHGGTANYVSTVPGFGSGVLNVVRLTSINQLACP